MNAIDLSVNGVLAAACARDGLTDFGDDSFREPLQVLIDSLVQEAHLNDVGRMGQFYRTVDLLVNRLRVEDWFQRHPEIANERIEAPVVIVGLPRTGTTMLHRILASDSRFFAPIWYEVRHPAPFPGWAFDGPDPRIPAAEAEVAMMLEANPDIAAIHPMNATGADEEIMLLEHSFFSTTPPAFGNVPSYMAWQEAHDNTPGYRYLKRLLQFLQWQKKRQGQAGQRWLLKTPHHLHCMDILLREFPDAVVIQTHRDPLQTIPSIASFHYELWKLGSDVADPVAVGQMWAAKFAKGMHHTMAVRDGGADSRFLDVQYNDTVADPFGVIGQVYDFIGMALTPQARQAMEHWQEENRRDSRPAHHYTLAEFGFTEAGIAAQFAEYRERFILAHQSSH
ncbi:MAG: sulfotransferase [Gammaproteobacteria bacterium]|nr:MAG: sulfotransferase [Gammaproteobacteria bacterium]